MAGLYKVDKTGNPDCLDQTEIWTVDDVIVENPIIAIANDPLVNGNVNTCPITGDLLPELFLCSGGEQYLDSGFVNATNIVWERLDFAACPTVVRDEDCPTFDSACDPDWVQVATTRDFTVIDSGEYRIRAEFEGNCTKDFYFNVFINDYAFSVEVVSDIVCDSEGILRVTNPSEDYEYQLITPQGTTIPYQVFPEFTGLVEAGEYTLNARQNNGLPSACIFQYNVVLNRIDPLISVNVNQPICLGDLGDINIMVTDGNPSYVYQVTSRTNSFTITQGPIEFPDYTFTGLEIGTYDVEVLSNNEGCFFIETVTIVAPIAITADVFLTQDYICNANGIQFAEITVTNPLGGNGDYRYSLDGVDYSNTTGVFTGLTSGVYNVYIVDTATSPCPVDIGAITVGSLEEISIPSITTVDGTCNGDTGSATFTVEGINLANDTYSYEVTTNNVPAITGTNISSASITLNNLIPGVYTINVINDNSGCRYNDTFSIQESSPIIASIDTIEEINCDNDEATVVLDISGGTPPYELSIDNIDYITSNSFTFTEGGNYTVFVRDSNACIAPLNVTINEVSQIDIELDLSGTQIICYAGATASIDAMVTGGTGIYSYTLTGTDYLGSAVSVGPQATSAFSGLFAGTYAYTVTSDTCMASIPFDITQPTDFDVSITSRDVTNCNGIENGSITVNVMGSTAPYFYSLYDAGNNPLFAFIGDEIDGVTGQHTFDNLLPGVYRVEIQDANGCPQAVPDIIINQSVVEIDLNVVAITTNESGSITVNASGGTGGGYSYELRDATNTNIVIPVQSSNVFIVDTAGDYTVRVIDTNDCFYDQAVTVDNIGENPIIDYADEILFCAITGQSYPVITIQNENGEVLDIPFSNVLSILWQQLDEVSCNRPLDETCPTTDDSCSSDWFNFETGTSCTITEPGEYRVVITFNTKSGASTKTYYFRANGNLLNTEDVQDINVNLYPNPAKTIVTINTEVKNIRVFDLSGKTVIETSQKSFDISTLGKGVYFTEVETIAGTKQVIKLLKE
ncbi:T9SS type A sorting domain-containing protein [Aquimarina sp. 2201CG14-23]|uniref:T9SS type A sorting domain-containing protein n=1 Tax=Aquimarina mycalae TaxID=3040073 RepID=UPI0032AEF1A9